MMNRPRSAVRAVLCCLSIGCGANGVGPSHDAGVDGEGVVTLAELRGDFAELEELFGAEADRDIAEGSGHLGRSAVTQFIGRRRASA